MNPSFHLYQLQKIDSQILSLESRLKEISDQIKHDSDLKTALLAFDEKSASLRSANTSLKDIEQKVLIKRNRLEQSESSLYAGNIKNPKELQDLQKEIVSLKNVISGYEEEQMEQMLLIEQLEIELQACDNQLKMARAAYDDKQSKLADASRKIEIEKSNLLTTREISLSQVSSQLILTYEELRKKKSGVAVAKVEDQTCSLCGSGLTPAECQTAKSSTNLFFCSSCGRILYAD